MIRAVGQRFVAAAAITEDPWSSAGGWKHRTRVSVDVGLMEHGGVISKRLLSNLFATAVLAASGSVLLADAGGGGPIQVETESGSIPPSEREFAETKIRQYVEQYGALSQSTEGDEIPPLEVFPLAGRFWHDIVPLNYVDLDPSSGLLDWNCTDFTTNGHEGTDVALRTFREQDIGVPVVAAQDGVVIAIHDGEFDKNIQEQNEPSNFVIIDHGYGREGWYWHLKRDSIEVNVGQQVFAGQQIAEAGSSGNSEGPHLHFEVRQDGIAVDPFAGPCRFGKSLWRSQPELETNAILNDLGLTTEDLSYFPSWPERWPTTGQISTSDTVLRVWFLGANLPANSHWLVRFRRPDGSYLPGAVLQYFGNGQLWRRFHWWWPYNIGEPNMQTGTWSVQIFVNDELMVEAPFEVTADYGTLVTHTPEPISIHIEPTAPQEGLPVQCIVDTPLLVDDLDYDVVQFHYIWSVNNSVVRRITTAAQTDFLDSGAFVTSDKITCGVTTTDGHYVGSMQIVGGPAAQPSVPAIDEWGIVALTLALLIGGTMVLHRRSYAV